MTKKAFVTGDGSGGRNRPEACKQFHFGAGYSVFIALVFLLFTLAALAVAAAPDFSAFCAAISFTHFLNLHNF
jgi:hypothetical protein